MFAIEHVPSAWQCQRNVIMHLSI